MTPQEAEAELFKHHGWKASTLNVWVRAKGHCEYCEADLLGSVSVYFHGAQIDHIIPGTGDGPENLALSCTACNRLKRHRKVLATGEVRPERETLIERARSYIDERRADAERRRLLALPLLIACGVAERADLHVVRGTQM
jgi:HNH endonuclease